MKLRTCCEQLFAKWVLKQSITPYILLDASIFLEITFRCDCQVSDVKRTELLASLHVTFLEFRKTVVRLWGAELRKSQDKPPKELTHKKSLRSLLCVDLRHTTSAHQSLPSVTNSSICISLQGPKLCYFTHRSVPAVAHTAVQQSTAATQQQRNSRNIIPSTQRKLTHNVKLNITVAVS
jgi:hypothetical protein